MKKRFVVILVLMSLISTSCYSYSSERPYNYPPAKWVSDTPDVWFVVSDDNYDKNEDFDTSEYVLEGQLNLDGETIELEVYFKLGNRVCFIDKNESSPLRIGDEGKLDYVLFDGSCKFSSDKLIVKIDRKEDKVFDGKYKEITFERIPEETTNESE